MVTMEALKVFVSSSTYICLIYINVNTFKGNVYSENYFVQLPMECYSGKFINVHYTGNWILNRCARIVLRAAVCLRISGCNFLWSRWPFITTKLLIHQNPPTQLNTCFRVTNQESIILFQFHGTLILHQYYLWNVYHIFTFKLYTISCNPAI